MKKLFEQSKGILKSKKGDIIQWVIVIIVIAIVATQALPPLMNSITDKGSNSVEKLDSLDSALDSSESGE